MIKGSFGILQPEELKWFSENAEQIDDFTESWQGNTQPIKESPHSSHLCIIGFGVVAGKVLILGQPGDKCRE